jgi:uncharacterized phage protein (TIGR01671 family)
MQILEFRIWDKQNKKMIKSSDANYWDTLLKAMKDKIHSTYRPFSPYTIELYTGAVDINNVQIYENDHVISTNKRTKKTIKGTVEYVEWIAGFAVIDVRNRVYPLNMSLYGIEVIGNFHENPHMSY